MARRNPTSSFSGQITAMLRQTVVQRFHRPSPVECWEPAINVYELHDRLEVCVDLAGVSRERLQVHVEPGRLWVEGVRQTPAPSESGRGTMRIVHMEIDDGPFRRELDLPPTVLLDQVRSTYREGMLCITLPLQPKRGRSRRG